MPSPVRFAKVRKMLEAKGYTLLRSKGSHFLFVKPGVGAFPVPVHNNLVKAVYVKKIAKL